MLMMPWFASLFGGLKLERLTVYRVVGRDQRFTIWGFGVTYIYMDEV